MAKKSINEELYFITFVGDHLRMIWDSSFNTKDHVLEVLKEFHTKVELQTKQKLKSVHGH